MSVKIATIPSRKLNQFTTAFNKTFESMFHSYNAWNHFSNYFYFEKALIVQTPDIDSPRKLMIGLFVTDSTNQVWIWAETNCQE